MSDFKTKADILRHLADGGEALIDVTIFRLSEEGFQVRVLPSQLWVPVSLKLDLPVGAYRRYVAPPPPNPHTEGTFMWAAEELKRGRSIRRRGWIYSIRPNSASDDRVLAIADVDATDWLVVK